MNLQKRIYDTILSEHLSSRRQMAFVSGPRQVGKTTTCRSLAEVYLNWDNTDNRSQILKGPAAVAELLGLDRLRKKTPVVLFDELHKFPRWKQFLKGFFDTYADQAHTLVTGSSRLDIHRRGGDSLMGRYFIYRMHPFTIAEIITQALPDAEKIIRPPHSIGKDDFEALWTHGGYPEPFIKRSTRFTRLWRNLRHGQLLREDVRDLAQIAHLDQLESLVGLLGHRSGQQLVYSNLASEIQVSVDTAKRWINMLCSLHFGFLLRPWFKNVSRSLRKEPKWFLRDWSGIDDPGQKAETFVACHLLKAVEGWNDLGLGDFQLGYVRNVYQQEVDFVVVRDNKPWFLVEVKFANDKLSPTLVHYQQQLKAPFAFQVIWDADYIDADCFAANGKSFIVPAKTFLSQLL
jgi:predicted AAA+ superfamily ATPase